MTKQEFLNTLRISLNGKISPESVEDNLSYYEDYINTQIRMGGSEQEILNTLGDPRLIARSIIEAYGKEQGNGGEKSHTQATGASDEPKKRNFRIPVWLWIFLIVFLIVFILSAVFSLLWAMLPILLPILLVLVIVNIIRKNF